MGQEARHQNQNINQTGSLLRLWELILASCGYLKSMAFLDTWRDHSSLRIFPHLLLCMSPYLTRTLVIGLQLRVKSWAISSSLTNEICRLSFQTQWHCKVSCELEFWRTYSEQQTWAISTWLILLPDYKYLKVRELIGLSRTCHTGHLTVDLAAQIESRSIIQLKQRKWNEATVSWGGIKKIIWHWRDISVFKYNCCRLGNWLSWLETCLSCIRT